MSDKTFDNIAFGDRDDSYCVGDPVLTDENVADVVKVQEAFDTVQAIKSDPKRSLAAREAVVALGDVSL